MSSVFGDIGSGAATGAAAGSIIPGWGTVIGAGIGAVGGLFSFLGKQNQASAERARLEEELRRKKAQDAQLLGQATASGAASGVEFDSSSLQGYLGEMKAEMARQLEWQRKAGETNIDNGSTASGIGLFTDLAGTMNNLAKQNNYWKV
jgi:hypothetical protein